MRDRERLCTIDVIYLQSGLHSWHSYMFTLKTCACPACPQRQDKYLESSIPSHVRVSPSTVNCSRASIPIVLLDRRIYPACCKHGHLEHRLSQGRYTVGRVRTYLFPVCGVECIVGPIEHLAVEIPMQGDGTEEPHLLNCSYVRWQASSML